MSSKLLVIGVVFTKMVMISHLRLGKDCEDIDISSRETGKDWADYLGNAGAISGGLY